MSEFPYKQTAGRTRELNTVAPDPNAGLIARPTQTEGVSLFTQVENYVNNWLGDIGKSNQVKDDQSLYKASLVAGGSESDPFKTIADKYLSESAFKTYGDVLLEKIGVTTSRLDPGAKVAGRPPAPETTHYQYQNYIDKAFKDVQQYGQTFVDQIKGYFNIAYEGPTQPAANAAPNVGAIEGVGTGGAAIILLVLLALLVLK